MGKKATESKSQLGFFEAEQQLPEGFVYQPDLISAEEEAELLEEFRNLPFREFEFHGYLGKRRVVSFVGDTTSTRASCRNRMTSRRFFFRCVSAQRRLLDGPLVSYSMCW